MSKKIKVICALCLSIMLLSCAQSYRDMPSKAPTGGSPASNAETVRETGRDYLVEGKEEELGYGLYSYLLLGAPPAESTQKERYIRMLNAFLNIPEIKQMQRYHPTCELNITYLPLTDMPINNPSAEWLLEHYDYARSRMLLRSLNGKHRNGPYIISTYKPLSKTKRLSGQYLYQDLSSTPPEIIILWVKEFLNQVEQKQFWEERTIMQCVIKLRENIAIAASGFPQVKESVTTLISWKE